MTAATGVKTRKASRHAAYQGTWDGGYVLRDSRGRKLYVIRRQVAGVRYDISTGCHSERAAYVQLARFESDPDSYTPVPDAPVKRDALRLTAELVAEFLRYGRDKGNGDDWLDEQRVCLAWWADRIGGVDLRRADLEADFLRHNPQRRHAVVLKAFYGWLRKQRHSITAGEDPTFAVWSVRPPKRAQDSASKVIAPEVWEAALKAMREKHPASALAMEVALGTGWHARAVIRFAEGGEARAVPAPTGEVAGIIVTPEEKHGQPQANQVSARVLRAARALLDLGPRPWATGKGGFATQERRLHGDLAEVRKELALPRFGFGWHRHTVSTEAQNQLGDFGRVAAGIGNSEAMQRTTYASLAVRPKLPTRI